MPAAPWGLPRMGLIRPLSGPLHSCLSVVIPPCAASENGEQSGLPPRVPFSSFSSSLEAAPVPPAGAQKKMTGKQRKTRPEVRRPGVPGPVLGEGAVLLTWESTHWHASGRPSQLPPACPSRKGFFPPQGPQPSAAPGFCVISRPTDFLGRMAWLCHGLKNFDLPCHPHVAGSDGVVPSRCNWATKKMATSLRWVAEVS